MFAWQGPSPKGRDHGTRSTLVGNLEGEGFADGGRRDRVWPAAMGGSDTLGSDSRTVDGATRGCRDGHMRLLALASFATTRFASGAPTSRNGRHCDTRS